MTQAEILDRLQEIFDDLFLEKVVVRPELTAAQVKEWTSLFHINVMLAIERKFGIRFRVGEVEGAQNVGQLASLIQSHLESAGTRA